MVHELVENYTPSEDLSKEFRQAYNLPIPSHPRKPEMFYNQLKLIKEEMEEVEKAYLNEPLENYFKELCDLQYVVDQLFVASGMQLEKEAGMIAVHQSNMSKLGEDGKPIYREDGKILKGPNYRPVRLETLRDILSS